MRSNMRGMAGLVLSHVIFTLLADTDTGKIRWNGKHGQKQDAKNDHKNCWRSHTHKY